MNRTHLSKFQIDMFQEDLPQHLVSAKSIVQGVKSAGSSCNWKLLRTRNYIFIYIYYVILNKYIHKYVKRGREGEKDAATGPLIYMARASVECGSFQEDAPYYGQGA